MNQRLCYLTTNGTIINPSAATPAQVQAMLACRVPLQGETERQKAFRRTCYLTQRVEVNPFNKIWVAQFFRNYFLKG